MLKQALKIAASFGLLVAGYVGYERAFVFASGFVSPPKLTRVVPASERVTPSRDAKIADRLAVRAFGPEHWTARPRDSMRYNNPAAGYWIYTQKWERLNAGKEMKFTPFVVIWGSKDGKSLKTLTAREATVQLEKPLDMTNAGGVQVASAQAKFDVWITDDKGTASKDDDLKIGPMTHMDFDGRRDQIRSSSDIHLVDRNLDLTSLGVVIDLRPTGVKGAGGSGYAGARTITFLRNVKVDVEDVGKSGIVPGSEPLAAVDPKAARKSKPGQARSAGPLRIDLPPPRPIPAVGPPMPTEPTLAHFEQQVTVKQWEPGKPPDQIDGDHLYLTLVPAEELPTTVEASRAKREAKALLAAKPKTAVEGQSEPEDAPTGPVSELTLVTARATGFAVFLQSPSRGIKGRGSELLYKRNAPLADDLIYFSGIRYTDVEKENHVVGKDGARRLESVDRLRAKDLNIFQRPDGTANVVARGPGRMETRATKGDQVARTAVFRDELVMVTIPAADGSIRRRLTLKGKPSVTSVAQGSLSARDQIVAVLKPKPKVEGAKPESKEDAGGGGEFAIEQVDAIGDVDLLTAVVAAKPGDPAPARRHIHGRDRLHAEFEEAEVAVDAPPGEKVADAQTVPKADAPAVEAAQAPPKPAEPAIEIEADEVWAWITQGAGPKGKADLREARLRGKVTLDQAPEAGQLAGLHLDGDKVDMTSQGEGRMHATAIGTPKVFATASTPEMTITGLKLRVDQKADRMWSPGPGTLTQHPKAPDKESKAVVQADDAKPRRGPSGPVVIRWADSMEFLGTPADAEGFPGPARATFVGLVRATADNSVLNAGRMVATMDKPVPFARVAQEPGDKADAEPRPQIEEVHCYKNVVVVNRELDEATKVLKAKQRVEGQDVRYHRPSGHFEVVGAGLVDYYARGEADPADGDLARKPSTVPVAAQPKPKPKVAPLKPLELTRIKFARGMKGQLTAAEDPDQSREADFDGGSEVLRAVVADEDATLDRDSLPGRGDYMIMTSRKLHVSSVPLAAKSNQPKGAPKAKTLLDAQGEAHVDTRDKAIAGDRITYDSSTALSFVYGYENQVVIAQQGGAGQPSTFARGNVVRFNHKTKDTQLIDPAGVQFVDGRGAMRTYPSTPTPEVKETKPKRNFRPNIPGDKEKRSFTGK